MAGFLKKLLKLAAWLAALAVVGLVVLYFIQNLFVYPGGAVSRGDTTDFQARLQVITAAGFRPMEIDGPDPQVKVTGLWGESNQGTAPAVLWFHGREETIAEINHEITPLKDMGYHVFAMEYRGFGAAGGSPSEENILADASAAFDWVWNQERVAPRRVFVGGWSLGAVVAIQLGNRKDAAGVIAVAPLRNMATVVKEKVPYLPLDLLLRDKFDAMEAVKGCRAPVFIVHGSDDEVTPIGIADQLAAFSPKGDVYRVEGAKHADVFSRGGKDLWQQVDTFIATSGR